jgi:hypothetical protein
MVQPAIRKKPCCEAADQRVRDWVAAGSARMVRDRSGRIKRPRPPDFHEALPYPDQGARRGAAAGGGSDREP